MLLAILLQITLGDHIANKTALTTKNLDKYVSKDFIDSLQSIGVTGLTTLKDIFIFRDLNFWFLVFLIFIPNREKKNLGPLFDNWIKSVLLSWDSISGITTQEGTQTN